MVFRKALAGDLEAVANLYQSAIGRPGCVWDDEYPTVTEAAHDLEGGNLYVLELDGSVIGAVSVLCENEWNEFADWQVADGSQREIARVVISEANKGKGYAVQMLEALFSHLAHDGCRAIRLTVAKANPAAMNTYKKLGFEFLNEAFMYGHDYWLCEKVLKL